MENLQIGSLELAYLGDAVIELMVRERLVKAGYAGAGKLNKMSLDYVRATAQSAALENILDMLSEEEMGVFKRARNAKKTTRAKSASIAEYNVSTGFEAVLGFLYITGNYDRLSFILNKGIKDEN